MTRPIALITGASAGIGAELARECARGGFDVILTARRADRLSRLADELGPTTRVIVEDLADPAGPSRLVSAAGGVDLLVNNAGFGAAGRFAQLDCDRQLAILQVNVAALTALARLVLPGMLAQGRGRILNVASVVAFQPGPGLAVYSASKAYVLSLSEAMSAELAGTGVTVTCLCPGSTTSEFSEVAGMGGRTMPFTLSAAEVARAGFVAVMAGRRLVVTGATNKAIPLATRLLPRGVLLGLVRRALMGRLPPG